MEQDIKKKNLILFGAGKMGIEALQRYGKKVFSFCDNDWSKHGQYIEGVRVISFEEMVDYHHQGYQIMITPIDNIWMRGQLEVAGITSYLIYKEVAGSLEELYEIDLEIIADNKLYIECSAEIDSIKDISALKRIVSEMNEKGCPNDWGGLHSESRYYGNINALMEYAQIPMEEIKYFPRVSHNSQAIFFLNEIWHKAAVVVMGNDYKHKIHKHYPYVPVFTVGPYIQYVNAYYSDKEREEKKAICGKTAVYFAIRIADLQEGKKYVDMFVERCGDNFDSLWMCVYWSDVNDEICQYAEDKGIQIVSAGLRIDSNFIRRLKSILEFADEIVGVTTGTNMIYALQLDKKITMIDLYEGEIPTEMDLKTRLNFSDEYKELLKGFRELLAYGDKNKELREFLDSRIGYSIHRDREYIKAICQISKDVWLACKGDLEYYPEAVKEIYRKYSEESNFYYLEILKDATDGYVNEEIMR